MEQPDKIYKLPKKLKEISGMDIHHSGLLYCVEDENGKIYLYDLNKSKLYAKSKFAKDGDYESLAIINNTVYVLNSNGTLHSFELTDSTVSNNLQFKLPLDLKNNPEGMCYDAANNRLLIACKDNTLNGEYGLRAIYAFNLDTKKLNNKPAYTISQDQVLALLDKEKKLPAKHPLYATHSFHFQPSGIAIHPRSKDIYICSSVGQCLLVLDAQSGKIKSIETLNPIVFPQVEAICFDDKANLYLATEGKEKKAKIYSFHSID